MDVKMADESGEDPLDMVGARIRHSQSTGNRDTWITRYDPHLDAYTLYAPFQEKQVLTRNEMSDLASDTSTLIQPHAESSMLEDTSSKYVGIWIQNRNSDGSIRHAIVQAYLPFHDTYLIQFQNGSSEDIAEIELHNRMIFTLRQTSTPPSTDAPAKKVKKDKGKRKQANPVKKAVSTDSSGGNILDLTSDVEMKVQPIIDLEIEEPVDNLVDDVSDAPSDPVEPPVEPPVEELAPISRSALLRNAPNSRKEPVQPLESRTAAFKVVRDAVAELLERPETEGENTNTIQRSVIHNSDIKDRDAVRRFVEAKGMRVLNQLLKTYASGCDEDKCWNLSYILKLIAMISSPTEEQVSDSGIGKTIGSLCRKHPTLCPIPLPQLIRDLAKYIKKKWIRDIKRSPTLNKPKRVARAHGIRPTRATAGMKRPREPDVKSNPKVIPAPSEAPRVRSLKPDWMRKGEELSRTRVTLSNDEHAERRKYKVSVSLNEQHPKGGGERGVYGRRQKLSFGSSWQVQDFDKHQPPSDVSKGRISRSSDSSLTRGYGVDTKLGHKSILRQQSQYKDSPTL